MKRMGIFLLTITHVCAEFKDLGVFGSTFPIAEKNIIHVLKSKMQSEHGKELLAKIENKRKKIMHEEHYHPKAVNELLPTTVHNSYLFDPAISLSNDLTDHLGARFYKAGDVLNPLEHTTLSKDYVFIDGDRPKQVKWALQKHRQANTMIVLVKGDPLNVMKEHQTKVFFDQEGAMTHRFQLTHVPCVMQQEGKRLRITEVTEEELLS
jgi:conjugal transfer pilus assembly protein TraW